jgi:hypothetical protein
MSFTPYSKEDQLNRGGGLSTHDLQKYKDMPMARMKAKAVEVCHEYIRERDREGDHFTCISCGIIKLIKKGRGNSNYHAGHFMSAGEYPMLKFDEVNINGQCLQCNYFKSGKLELYTENLIKKWGRAEYDRLLMVAAYNKRAPKKWTKIELVDIIKTYTNKLKNLKCQQQQ